MPILPAALSRIYVWNHQDDNYNYVSFIMFMETNCDNGGKDRCHVGYMISNHTCIINIYLGGCTLSKPTCVALDVTDIHFITTKWKPSLSYAYIMGMIIKVNILRRLNMQNQLHESTKIQEIPLGCVSISSLSAPKSGSPRPSLMGTPCRGL